MDRTLSRRAFCLGAATLPAAASFASQDAAKTYHWSYQARVGDIQRYRTYIRITGRQADDAEDLLIMMKSASKHTIKQVAEDGVVTYDQSDEKAAFIVNGKPVEDAKAPTRPPVVVSINRDGLIVSRVNPSADPFNGRYEKSIIAIQSMPTPPTPVKVGANWTTRMANPMLKNGVIDVATTLVGVQIVTGQPALKLISKMVFPTTFGANEAEIVHSESTYYLHAETYDLLQADYQIKNPALPFPGLKVLCEVKVFRVIVGANDTGDPDGDKLLSPPKKM